MFRRSADAVLRAIRRPPWLTGIVALIGALLFTWSAVQAIRSIAEEGRVAEHIAYVYRPESRNATQLAIVHSLAKTALLCFLPAGILAIIRQRGRALVLPLFLACAGIGAWWISTDIITHLDNVLDDPMGLNSTPGPYVAKLCLIAVMMLCLPLLLALYYHSTLLDRYVARSFAAPFLLCLGGTVGIWIIMDLLDNSTDFAERELGGMGVARYYLGQAPRILVLLTEAALLLATLFTIGRMSRHNEIISMLGSGRSVVRVLAPLLIFGLWCSVAILALNYHLAPESDQNRQELFSSKKDNDTYSSILYRNRLDRRTWLIGRVPMTNSNANRFEEVHVFTEDDQGRLLNYIAARNAYWSPTTRGWKFANLLYYEYAKPETPEIRNEHPLRVWHDRMDFTEPVWRETPGVILEGRRDPDTMGVPDLRAFLVTNAERPESVLARFRTAEQWRYALPLRCFLMVLIAAPLGIVASRRNMLGGVTIAIAIFVLSYFISSILIAAAGAQYISPIAGAWLLDAVILVVGLLLLWMRSANRSLASFNPFRRPTRAR